VIEARKHPLLNWLFYNVIVRPAFRSGFSRVNARFASTSVVDPAIPLIWYANHSTWWDGFFCMMINEARLRRQAYAMIEEAQIARYGFFRWAGGFSVNRQDARSAVNSLNYAVRMLTAATNRMLMIFPQGEILGNELRPLRFFSGIGHIVKGAIKASGRCALLPCALRYEFVGEQKPEAFASHGEPLIVDSSVDPKSLTATMELALTKELDALRDDVAHYRFDRFSHLLSGGVSINRLWDRISGRDQIDQVGR
jgi:chlorobactene lauroyltransferase